MVYMAATACTRRMVAKYTKRHFVGKRDKGCACILSKKSIPTMSQRCFVHHEFSCYLCKVYRLASLLGCQPKSAPTRIV